MSETIVSTFYRSKISPFLVSSGLHGVFLLLIFVLQLHSQRSPFGVYRRGDSTLIELVSSQSSGGMKNPVPTPITRTSVTHSLVTHGHAETITQASPHASNPKLTSDSFSQETSSEQMGKAGFGFRDGVAKEGQVGDSSGVQANERDHYLYELKILVEGRKVYPLISKRLGEKGKIVVQFEIKRDGQINAIQMKSPSHFNRLNEAAINLIASIKQYKALPTSIHGDKLQVEIPIEYVLN